MRREAPRCDQDGGGRWARRECAVRCAAVLCCAVLCAVQCRGVRCGAVQFVPCGAVRCSAGKRPDRRARRDAKGMDGDGIESAAGWGWDGMAFKRVGQRGGGAQGSQVI